jgi:hypothetical protein
MENSELKSTNKLINFESEIEDWEGFIQKHYGEKKCQNQPQFKEVYAKEPTKKKMKMTYDHNANGQESEKPDVFRNYGNPHRMFVQAMMNRCTITVPEFNQLFEMICKNCNIQLDTYYGNMGCQVFKRGYKIRKIFA